jgi:hypothetical protein
MCLILTLLTEEDLVMYDDINLKEICIIKEECCSLSDLDIEIMHDEMLDDVYEPYVMGELTFYPSDILKDCDTIAYNMSIRDYINNCGDVVELDGQVYFKGDVDDVLGRIRFYEE